MKKLGVPFALLIALVMVGCGGVTPVGTWTGNTPGGAQMPKMSLTIKGDKTFEGKIGDSKIADVVGTWEMKDKKVTMNATKVGGMDLPKEAQKPEVATLADDGKTMELQGMTLTKQ